MKKILLLACFLVISHANLRFENEWALEIGQSCSQNPIYVISSFTVTPTPTAGATVTIAMSGTFSQSEAVGNIQTGLKLNNQWRYQQDNINESYVAGQSVNFSYSITIPQASGNYLAQVTVNEASQQNYLSCWQFTFSI